MLMIMSFIVCLHVCLICALNYYLLTYLLTYFDCPWCGQRCWVFLAFLFLSYCVLPFLLSSCPLLPLFSFPGRWWGGYRLAASFAAAWRCSWFPVLLQLLLQEAVHDDLLWQQRKNASWQNLRLDFPMSWLLCRYFYYATAVQHVTVHNTFFSLVSTGHHVQGCDCLSYQRRFTVVHIACGFDSVFL